MTTAVALETFRRLSLAQELSDPQCERLLSVMTLRTLSDGDVLIEEGQRDDALYLLIDGALSVCNRTGGGDWNIIHVLKSGDVAGELGFLDGEPRTATLRSLGTVRVLELKRANFETLLMEDPKLVYHVMRAIIRQVHSIVRRMNTHFVELHNYISHQHGRY